MARRVKTVRTTLQELHPNLRKLFDKAWRSPDLAECVDFATWVMPVLGSMRRTQHCICNVLIEIKGDKAFSESYFIAHHTLPQESGGDQFMIAAGRYLDRFERRNGEWKFAHRQACYDWNSSVPSTDSWNRVDPGKWTFGTRGEADMSYLNFAGRL